MRFHRLMASAAVCVLATFAATRTEASQVRPVNLEQMTARAATIFEGRCTEIRSKLDEELGRPVTLATFEVERAVKGDVGSTVTIRLLDGPAGVPRFLEDEEVILFLYGESSLGLTSPVGLGQGRFRIHRDKSGARIAINDFSNAGLFREMSGEAESRLGAAFATWKERSDLEPTALLDMAETLRISQR